MLKTKSAILVLAIFTLFGVSGQVAYGNAPDDQQFIVLIDRHAVVESQNNRDLTESFLGLLSMLKDGERITLVTADDGAMRGPEIAGSAEYKVIHRNTLTTLTNSSVAPEADLVDALASNRGVVLIEMGVRPRDSNSFDDLRLRCEVVSCTKDERMRFRLDASALSEAIEKASTVEDWPDSFFETYFHG